MMQSKYYPFQWKKTGILIKVASKSMSSAKFSNFKK